MLAVWGDYGMSDVVALHMVRTIAAIIIIGDY
jgi:hypothetical protein